MIQRINDKETFTHRWIADVERMQSVLLSKGYSSLLEDCASLWGNYSDSMCAGWMELPQSDEDLAEHLISIIKR